MLSPRAESWAPRLCCPAASADDRTGSSRASSYLPNGVGSPWRFLRKARPYLALSRSMLPKRLASTPFGDTKRCRGVKHVGRTKLGPESPRRRLHQDELFQCQIRYQPTQPGDLGLKLGQMLGQIALEASVPMSPPIVSYFGNANFPHTLRNPSAPGGQSFNMSQLCNDFLGIISSHHRPFP
jgi:hypothetical protein